MPLDSRLKRRLKLRDLDILMTVARNGSMAKAAGELAISQPAISKAISEMERTLGVRLFDRSAQGVEATLYGRALLKWAAAVFDDVRQGVEEIKFLTDPGAGELRIGASEPMQGGFVPEVIDRLKRRHPRIAIHISPISQWTDQLRELRARNIDVQVGRLMQPMNEDDLQTYPLFNDRPAIVASPHHSLARRRKLSLADLIDEAWSLPPAETNVAGELIARAFQMHGQALPRNSVITPAIQVHSALVATNRYLAVFPASLLQFGLKHMRLRVLPVRWPIEHTPVGITVLKNRTLSPVARLFIECAREVGKLVGEPKRHERR